MVSTRMSKARKNVRRRQKMIREQMSICNKQRKSGVSEDYEAYLLGKLDVLKEMEDFLYWLEDEVA
jgi:hypothetical protein